MRAAPGSVPPFRFVTPRMSSAGAILFAAVGSVIGTARRHGIDAYQRFAIRYREGYLTLGGAGLVASRLTFNPNNKCSRCNVEIA